MNSNSVSCPASSQPPAVQILMEKDNSTFMESTVALFSTMKIHLGLGRIQAGSGSSLWFSVELGLCPALPMLVQTLDFMQFHRLKLMFGSNLKAAIQIIPYGWDVFGMKHKYPQGLKIYRTHKQRIFKTEFITMILNDLPEVGGFTLECFPEAVATPLKMIFNSTGIEINDAPAIIKLVTEEGITLEFPPGTISMTEEAIESAIPETTVTLTEEAILANSGEVTVAATAAAEVSAGADVSIEAAGAAEVSAGADVSIEAAGAAEVSAGADVSIEALGAAEVSAGADVSIAAIGANGNYICWSCDHCSS